MLEGIPQIFLTLRRNQARVTPAKQRSFNAGDEKRSGS